MRAFQKRGLNANFPGTFSIFLCYTADVGTRSWKTTTTQLIKWTDLIALSGIQAEGGNRGGKGKEIKTNITS